MCDSCDADVIHHIPGERPIHREHCFCQCHDERDDAGHLMCGAKRDDETVAITACEKCRWAHVVAFSTNAWRADERYMQPPAKARDRETRDGGGE